MQPSQIADSLQLWRVSIASYPTACETKYAKLEQLLAAQQWQAADEETFIVLSAICGLTDDRTIKIGNLSCYDLHILNSLWQKYSHGCFGFSVQQQIWQQLCGAAAIEIHDSQHLHWQSLCDRVGWNGAEDGLETPTGHFPSRVAVDKQASVFHPEVFTRLYSNLEGCRLRLQPIRD